MAIGAVVARILTQYSDKGSKAANKDIAKLGKQFDAFAKKTAKAFGIAAAAVGAFAIKVGKDAVQAAIADQKSQVLLANSLRNTVGATDAAIASVEDYISNLQLQVGVADDDLRPALAKLAAVTGDVTSAQQLLGLALDVSAFSGSDLGTASAAITKALQGNFRTLQKLVPSISTATIKSKDFAAILAEVQKATQGSAAARAGTLEYKLNILRIRFGEILESLGYKLLPVLENFANVISNKVLPQIEAFIEANGQKLVIAFQMASEGAIKLLEMSIKFSDWVSNNMGLIKTMAGLIAGLFVVGKIGAFASALGKLTAAWAVYTAGAGRAAIATAYATGGASIGTATAAILAVGGLAAITGGVVALKNAGNKVRAGKDAENAARMRQMQDYQKFLSNKAKPSKNIVPDVSADNDAFAKLFANLNKMNNLENKSLKTKKELTKRQERYNELLADMGIKTTEQQSAITQFAIRENLLKQAAITGSPLTSIGSPTPMNMATAGMNNPITVNVQ
ncbi:MAG: hypothetical protein ACO3E4_07600, partial [Candidatus Nanopelagicaceae bacterium]